MSNARAILLIFQNSSSKFNVQHPSSESQNLIFRFNQNAIKNSAFTLFYNIINTMIFQRILLIALTAASVSAEIVNKVSSTISDVQ